MLLSVLDHVVNLGFQRIVAALVSLLSSYPSRQLWKVQYTGTQ